MSKKKEITVEEKLKETLISKEEQPYKIPDNWEWVKIGSITQVISGGTPRTSNGDYYNGEIAWITPKDLSNYRERFISKGFRSITELGLKNSSATLIPKNSVLMSSRAPIGYVAISKNEITTNQGFKSFKASKTFISEYLYFYLKNSKSYLESIATGTTFKELSLEKAKKIIFPLPPLEEQERIVNKLDSMLGRINEAKELIAQAKETFENRRASILNLAFNGELTKKWRESNSIESSKILLENLNKEKIRLWEEECKKALEEGKKKLLKPKLLSVEEMVISKEEQPYEIPESWEWVKLERIILNTQYGYTEKSSNIGEIKYLRITDIQNENVNWRSVPFCKITEQNKKKYLLNKNDIVIARTGATTGKSYLITDISLESVFASYLIRIRPILDIYKYLNKFFKSSLYWNQIMDMSSGIAQPGVNARKLETLNIPLPLLAEQKEIVRILDNVLEKEDKINEILEMEEMIELLEKSILDKAFRGELGTGNFEDIPSLEVLKNILEK